MWFHHTIKSNYIMMKSTILVTGAIQVWKKTAIRFAKEEYNVIITEQKRKA